MLHGLPHHGLPHHGLAHLRLAHLRLLLHHHLLRLLLLLLLLLHYHLLLLLLQYHLQLLLKEHTVVPQPLNLVTRVRDVGYVGGVERLLELALEHALNLLDVAAAGCAGAHLCLGGEVSQNTVPKTLRQKQCAKTMCKKDCELRGKCDEEPASGKQKAWSLESSRACATLGCTLSHCLPG